MTDVRDVAGEANSAAAQSDGQTPSAGLTTAPPPGRLFDRASTAGTRAGSGPATVSAEPAPPLTAPVGRGRELRRLRRRHKIAVALFSLVTLAAIGGAVLLGWDGYRTTRNIRGGTEQTGITDPTAPGFQAEVKPTPTELLVSIDDQAHLTDLQLLVSGPNGVGGAVVFIPGTTLIQADDVAGATLGQLYDIGGLDEVQKRVEAILGFAVLDAVEAGPTQLSALIGGSGPITISSPDDLFVVDGQGNRTVRFRAGSLTLTPDDIPDYLALEVKGEAATNRSARAQLVWEAWMKNLADPATRSALGSTTDPKVADVGQTVAGIAGGTTSFVQLPLTRVVIPDENLGVLYLPDPAATAERIMPLVPFPSSAFPGQRLRVSVLQGVAGATVDIAATGPIVAAGGEVVVIGNADAFGAATTIVTYREPSLKARAEEIVAGLGLDVTVAADPALPENLDVSVVFGSDFTGSQ